MLKPFRVKDLLDPALDDLLASHYDDAKSTDQSIHEVNRLDHDAPKGRHFSPFLQPASTHDGIVEVSKSDYDKTISRYPEAKLSYLDDEGEKVTVSTMGSVLWIC